MTKRGFTATWLALATAITLGAAGCGGEVDGGVDDGSNPALDTGGKCGARFVSQEERDAIDAYLAQNFAFSTEATSTRNIPVHFHVITSGGQGNVSSTMLSAQIKVLNDSYAGRTGGVNMSLTFTQASVDTTD